MLKQIAFLVVLAFSLGLFTYSFMHLVKIAALGRPANLKETWAQRIASLMAFFFGQGKVFEEKRSWHHLPIYWGFLILSIATVDIGLQGVLGSWFNLGVIVGPTAYGWLNAVIDVANLIVLAALVYAMARRFIRPAFIPLSLDAMLILSAISLLVLSHFGLHASHLATGTALQPGFPISGPIGQLLGLYTILPGGALQPHVDPHNAHIASEIFWWVHIGIVLGFLNYLPFSKHIHVLGSAPNILLRNQGPKNAMPKAALFDKDDPTDPSAEPLFENWGVARIEDFTWKSLIDNYACTECARCTNYCPAFATDKPLSPMHLIHDLKDEMKARGSLLVKLKKAGGSTKDDVEPPAGANKDLIAKIKADLAALPPLVGGRVKDETLWACTTCGACQEVCPVFIDHPLKILQMRQHIVLNDESGRTPGEVTRFLGNISNAGNPWSLNQDDRMKWAEGLDVKTVEDAPDAEYLLFVGCAGAYDDNAKKTTRALVKVLHAANVKFAVLGKQEKCSGESVRRLGAEMDYQNMAREQVQVMNEAKVTKVIASCPHCFHTIKNEYPQFGGNYEVLHHSQLIAHLLGAGKLSVGQASDKKFTYHDSCYIGRWNGVYDAPREILEKATGNRGHVQELHRNKEHGFCCGAGGGRMWMEEEKSKRVNLNRAKEVVESGANAVGVACPFCHTMLSDGLKHFGKDEEIAVVDIAVAIAATLPDTPARSAEQAS
jgi:Fe-S oxidoreductase